MQRWLTERLLKIWYHDQGVPYLLLPFAWIYQLIIFLRRQCYRLGVKKVTRFPVPVIVVGNITLGGTGKTPLVIWLARTLQELGYQPGIVSRGYGSHAKHYPHIVSLTDHSVTTGDEALLIARETGCPVVIAPDRVAAIQQLLATFNCSIVISDDGLQHYALAHDIEIIVIDGQRLFGNRHCLPAGPCREPLSRLNENALMVCNGNEFPNAFRMNLVPQAFQSVAAYRNEIKSIDFFKQTTVHAVAGIGYPKRFFNLLRQLGLTIIEHSFPDHFEYIPESLDFQDNLPIIMTAKDAVKCALFAHENYWYLPVTAELPGTFKKRLVELLSFL